ncbi:hypothetical protein KTO58_02895 [Chitinophaga pendula]|uniref:hypothetical protein n=1 Tax=Chitinophaga TaxID=79328 RepID=UPI000BAFEBB4|nr:MULTISPECIES: hypothetical protein [Chitinophaga]ASZ14215.1 hypothetical protein CK934_26325 [Chitinophaga sp. MD30]UCJ08145.1 hypothetical protein KTO58_02895 [Chitinophaga pendula]
MLYKKYLLYLLMFLTGMLSFHLPVAAGTAGYAGNGGRRAHATPYLYAGEALQLTQYLLSANGKFILLLTPNGNLKLYIRDTGAVLWETRTAGLGVYEARLNTSGSLGLHGINGYLFWTSGTFGYPTSYLYLQDDGNLVLSYYAVVVWSTNTGGH